MNEYPKFIPREDIIGSVQFREMDPGIDYVIISQDPRHRVVTFTPAPDYIPVKIDFLPEEDGLELADIRELVLSDAGLTEHSLAALLIDQKIVPFVSCDILRPIKYPEPIPEGIKQPDPTDPMTHLKDHFPEGVPTKRRRR